MVVVVVVVTSNFYLQRRAHLQRVYLTIYDVFTLLLISTS